MYIPKGKLDPNIYYTDGGEYIVLTTGLYYVGYYHKDTLGGVWTDKTHSVSSIKLNLPKKNTLSNNINTFNADSAVLATITKKTQSPINTSVNQPLQNALPPTPEDYNKTYFTRYIIKYKLSSQPYFVETDKNEYYKLQQSSDQKYYHFAEVLWKISGPLYDVKQDNVLIVGGIIDSNKRSTQEAEKNMLGISNYLTDLTLYSTF